MTVSRRWWLKIHPAITGIQRLCLLNSRSPSPVGVFHSWPDFRKNDLRDICSRLRCLGASLCITSPMSPPLKRGRSSAISAPRSLDCCQSVSKSCDLKFNTIVHASLCSPGGMISLLMKPGNLATIVSWCAFQVAKASSLPRRTFAVAMRTAGSLIVRTGLFFDFC